MVSTTAAVMSCIKSSNFIRKQDRKKKKNNNNNNNKTTRITTTSSKHHIRAIYLRFNNRIYCILCTHLLDFPFLVFIAQGKGHTPHSETQSGRECSHISVMFSYSCKDIKFDCVYQMDYP